MGKQSKVLETGGRRLSRRAKPQEKYTIEVCHSLICKLKKAANVQSSMEAAIDATASESRAKTKFCIGPVACLGLCKQAPALRINGHPFTRMNPEKASDLILSLSADPRGDAICADY